MTAQPTGNLDKILATIAALLARADHPNTPIPEAELSRTRAEKLMTKYRIAEATAVESGEVILAPVWRRIFVCTYDSEFRNHYYSLATALVDHVGGRYKPTIDHSEAAGGTSYFLDVCGYDSDLRYMELLNSATMLAFSDRLEPKFHPNESLASNAYRMRLAGMERNRIAKVLLGNWTTTNEMKQKTRKVTSLIKEGAALVDADPSEVLGRGNSVKTYRSSYADGFYSEFMSRLRRMRIQDGLEANTLVLSNRKGNVDEAFYERFPAYRPVETKGEIGGAQASKCSRCQKAKSGYCKDHSYLRPRKHNPRPFNGAAAEKGRAAARAVNLGGTGGRSLT